MAARHPTHDALLDAGLRLGDELGLSNVSVDRIVRQAGVAKGTFYVHFPDRTAYLVALHGRFFDDLLTAIDRACGHELPGLERLLIGTRAYLDTCLDAHGVKSVLVEVRADPAVRVDTSRRVRDLAAVAEADFRAMNVPHPDHAARLYLAMAEEVALIELETGTRSAPARAALDSYARARDRRAPA